MQTTEDHIQIADGTKVNVDTGYYDTPEFAIIDNDMVKVDYSLSAEGTVAAYFPSGRYYLIDTVTGGEYIIAQGYVTEA